MEKFNIYYDKETMKELKDFWKGRSKNRIVLTPIYYEQWRSIDDFFASHEIIPTSIDPDVKHRESLSENPELLNEYFHIQQACLSKTGRNCEIGAFPTGFLGTYVPCAIFGGDIDFVGSETFTWSYCKKPPAKTLDQLIKSFESFKKSEWIKKIMDILKFFVDKKVSYMIIPHDITESMNLVLMLRGVETGYLDIYDNPTGIKELLELSIEFNIYINKKQIEVIEEHNRKILADDSFYINSKCRIPEISVDAYSLASSDVYKDFGLDYQQKIIDEFGTVFMHIHSNGLHVLEEVVNLTNVSDIILTEDEGYKRPFLIRHELRKRAKDIPLSFFCSKNEFLDAFKDKTLCTNSRYIVPFCDFMDMDWSRSKVKEDYFKDVEEVNDILEKVRDY